MQTPNARPHEEVGPGGVNRCAPMQHQTQPQPATAPTRVLSDERDGTYAVGVAVREGSDGAVAIKPVVDGQGRIEPLQATVDTNDPLAVAADFQRKRRLHADGEVVVVFRSGRARLYTCSGRL